MFLNFKSHSFSSKQGSLYSQYHSSLTYNNINCIYCNSQFNCFGSVYSRCCLDFSINPLPVISISSQLIFHGSVCSRTYSFIQFNRYVLSCKDREISIHDSISRSSRLKALDKGKLQGFKGKSMVKTRNEKNLDVTGKDFGFCVLTGRKSSLPASPRKFLCNFKTPPVHKRTTPHIHVLDKAKLQGIKGKLMTKKESRP